jgi:DNA-binding transcriptional MerR regulator
MKIGELAQQSGIAASRIRFYEASGLLQSAQRQANGYREYTADTLRRLEIILCAQGAGFSLDEIRTLLPPDLDHWRHEDLLAALRRKIAEIESLEQRLAQSKQQLLALAHEIEHKDAAEDCAARANRLLNKVHKDAAQRPRTEPPTRGGRKRA